MSAEQGVVAPADHIRALRRRFLLGSGGKAGEEVYDLAGMFLALATVEADLITERRNHAMTWGTLDLVREMLDARGIDMSHTPPMMYPEAIAALVSRTVAAAVELAREYEAGLRATAVANAVEAVVRDFEEEH